MLRPELKRYNRLRMASFLALLFSLLVIIVAVDNLLVSCTLALVFAYILGPLIHYFERMGLRRVTAIFLCFTALVSSIALTAYLTGPFLIVQGEAFRTELPTYLQGTRTLLVNTERRLAEATGASIRLGLSERAEAKAIKLTEALFEDLPNLVSSYLTVLLLIPFLGFFVLKDGRRVSRTLLALVPNSSYEVMWNLYSQINRQMGQFVRARLFEAFIVGLIVWVGFQAIGFPYSGLLGLFAGLTNLIPYIGPVVGVIPPLLIALVSGLSDVQIFLMVSVYLFAQIVDAVVLVPFVVARIVDLHPISVVVALLLGAQFLGVLGMLLAIPLASAVKVASTNLYEHLVQSR
jgi:putative permease